MGSHISMVISFLVLAILHIDPEKAEIDACKIEHLISNETGDRMVLFLKFLLSGESDAKAFLKMYWDTLESELKSA